MSGKNDGGPIHEDDNGQADAHLIAAAPDLYDALNTVLAICDNDWPESKGPHVTIDAIRHHARSALARARGEAT